MVIAGGGGGGTESSGWQVEQEVLENLNAPVDSYTASPLGNPCGTAITATVTAFPIQLALVVLVQSSCGKWNGSIQFFNNNISRWWRGGKSGLQQVAGGSAAGGSGGGGGEARAWFCRKYPSSKSTTR